METSLPSRRDTATYADVAAGLDEMTDTDLTERFRELELQRRAAEAEMASIVDRIDRRGAYRDDGHRSVAGWIRAQVNCSGSRVTQLRRIGKLIRTEPDVGERLTSGRIGVDQTAELARARANPRCGDKLSESLDLLLGHANRLKYDEFRQIVKRWEMFADLDGAHRDRGDAVETRKALIAAGTDGIDLVATGGTALQAAEMQAILEQFVDAEFDADRTDLRDRLGPDAPASEMTRTSVQRSFDALLRLFRTANNSTADATPTAATVNIIIDQHSFERQLAAHNLADEPVDLARPNPAAVSCHTSRGTPVLPDDAMYAALGGWIRRVVIGADGVTIDLGHRSRCFTGTAAEAARLLATICELPGCTLPEHWSQVDHLTEWEDTGPTNQHNAAIACGHGNRDKHRQKRRTVRDKHGRIQVQRPDRTWITPVGVDPPTETELANLQLHRNLRNTGWTLWHKAA